MTVTEALQQLQTYDSAETLEEARHELGWYGCPLSASQIAEQVPSCQAAFTKYNLYGEYTHWEEWLCYEEIEVCRLIDEWWRGLLPEEQRQHCASAIEQLSGRTGAILRHLHNLDLVFPEERKENHVAI